MKFLLRSELVSTRLNKWGLEAANRMSYRDLGKWDTEGCFFFFLDVEIERSSTCVD